MIALDWIAGHACYPIAYCIYYVFAHPMLNVAADLAFMFCVVLFLLRALWRAD